MDRRIKLRIPEGEKYGVDQLKKLIEFVGKVEDDIADIIDDDKVRFLEILGFSLKRARGAVDIGRHAKEIKEQFLDLSDIEIIELAPTIEKAFEIEEGKAADAIYDYVVPFWEIIELTFEHVGRIKNRRLPAVTS